MSTTTTSNNKPKLRLWVLSWGLFPRRVTIYLEEKGISDDFDVIPVNIGADGKMNSPPGKPNGTLPLLEIAPPSNDEATPGKYVYQSIAILEYIEEMYAGRGPSMLGATPEERAQSRDLLTVLDEAVAFLTCYSHHASGIYAPLVVPQSPETARIALDRAHKVLSLLETMSCCDGPYLVTSKQPMIVDCVAMATIQFYANVYGVDLASEKHPRLARMYEAFYGRESAKWDAFVVPQGMVEVAKRMSVK
ncbi:hypothetical protein LTR10_003899 [Elasticomyces elasticus]|nr:hypothetical protein LTR10_003899 [Elasticomyces elasticus]KAK4977915.1 hypothetical protein LTR42_002290 [Elasticomyces elasticus]